MSGEMWVWLGQGGDEGPEAPCMEGHTGEEAPRRESGTAEQGRIAEWGWASRRQESRRQGRRHRPWGGSSWPRTELLTHGRWGGRAWWGEP